MIEKSLLVLQKQKPLQLQLSSSCSVWLGFNIEVFPRWTVRNGRVLHELANLRRKARGSEEFVLLRLTNSCMFRISERALLCESCGACRLTRSLNLSLPRGSDFRKSRHSCELRIMRALAFRCKVRFQ